MATPAERVASISERRQERAGQWQPATSPQAPRQASPPQYESVCEACDHYVGPGTPVCELIEARLEAEAGNRSCCQGKVIAATARVQRDGGCPDGRFPAAAQPAQGG